MTAPEIRQTFLTFFKSKGHELVPSAPIVVKNDPTLLFTNAGMNQFKDYFLGNKPAPYLRAADTQKCLRVSGKHNDLEEVGVDTYHHTMFEMLGNWSFGDYFKKEAIAWSWELLTEVYKIDKDRLYVTVFEGDESENLPFDEEAWNEWIKWIPENRILKGNKKDNFWEMGDTGPCGPCSEIHVDCRSEEERNGVEGASLVNADHPQVIEIWNNVFMEFDRTKDGRLQLLPARHVDTGMGFERLVRVLQHKQSNYDTDIFMPCIQRIEQLTGHQYKGSDSKRDVAFRVLADHIRAVAFTIADGQLPANTGAGYVIRRILRRAVRYYYSHLGYERPLLCGLVPDLAVEFSSVFPELAAQSDFVTKVIREEEEAFLRTLAKGLNRIEELLAQTTTGGEIPGKAAFELYDTYGFPLDLTMLIASEKGQRVDESGFGVEMARQKERSRKATATDTGDWTVLTDTPAVEFTGYEDLNIASRISRYRTVKAKGKQGYQVVLERTPFYAESGGQTGDTGVLEAGTTRVKVVDTRKENDLIVHLVDELPEALHGPLRAVVDWERRLSIMYNHSATHLLHAALREVLGQHVVQKGSLVTEEMLRFDFAHFQKVTEEEIRAVEQVVNQKIRENIPVQVATMSKEAALEKGAMALFGEKYGKEVRVVTMDPDFSVELCGGTHVRHTGMIGLLLVTAESAVASGVRRIEAVTGAAAIRFMEEKLSLNKKITALLKAKDPLKALERLLDEKAGLEKQLEQLENRSLAALSRQLSAEVMPIPLKGGLSGEALNFIGAVVEVRNADALKKLCFDIRHNVTNYVAVLCADIQGKAAVAIGIDAGWVERLGLDAGKIIKETVAPLIKGGGGGQKELATAGGQVTTAFPALLQQIRELLERKAGDPEESPA